MRTPKVAAIALAGALVVLGGCLPPGGGHGGPMPGCDAEPNGQAPGITLTPTTAGVPIKATGCLDHHGHDTDVYTIDVPDDAAGVAITCYDTTSPAVQELDTGDFVDTSACNGPGTRATIFDARQPGMTVRVVVHGGADTTGNTPYTIQVLYLTPTTVIPTNPFP